MPLSKRQAGTKIVFVDHEVVRADSENSTAIPVPASYKHQDGTTHAGADMEALDIAEKITGHVFVTEISG